MRILTAEQRYRQAIRKARIIARRQIEALMRGETDFAECTMDIERRCVIAEIARSMGAERAQENAG